MSFHSDPIRVLVVDDDPVITTLVCRSLEDAGFQPVMAGSIADARRALAGGGLDLMLLDVGLPDGDGYSLCREVKATPSGADLPVVFMTGHGAGPEVLQGFEVGGVDYVVKPFDPRVLLARVRTHTMLARLSRDLQSELDRRTERLRVAHRRMRELDSGMALAEERERRRLADQLHDTTIQQLVLAQIVLDRARGATDAGTMEIELARLGGLIDDAIGQLRTLVFDLSPPVLYQLGLFPALQWLAAQMTERWGLPYRCAQVGVTRALPDDLKVTLFQGARELLINVGRHARARRCDVALAFRADSIRLSVTDDGTGVDAADRGIGAGQGGFGLFSLRSRTELLGGGLDLSAASGGGTLAELWLPWSANQPGLNLARQSQGPGATGTTSDQGGNGQAFQD